MSYQQVLRDTGTNLTKTFYTDETATDADGAVTVTITNAAGTEIVSAESTSHGATGVYTYALDPQSDLDYLTVTWTGTFGGNVQTITDYVEIVGGFYFTLAELRASDNALSNTTNYPTAKLAEARMEVADEFESICTGWAFAPRFNRVTLSGNGLETVLLPHLHIRAIRSLSVDGTAYSADELADLSVADTGQVSRLTLGAFTKGTRNVLVAYEHGLDTCPPDVKRAAMMRAKYRLMLSKSGVPDRATTFTVSEGGTYRLDTASGRKVGVPEIDAVLERYSAIPSLA